VNQYVHVTVENVVAHRDHAQRNGAQLVKDVSDMPLANVSTRLKIRKAIAGPSPSTLRTSHQRVGVRR
jgi:hypothetical protein